jgi:hypothetical protein
VPHNLFLFLQKYGFSGLPENNLRSVYHYIGVVYPYFRDSVKIVSETGLILFVEKGTKTKNIGYDEIHFYTGKLGIPVGADGTEPFRNGNG